MPPQPLLRLLTVLLTMTVLSACIGAPGYRGPVSEHFDGTRFRNQLPHEEKSVWAIAGFLLKREPTPWPDWIENQPGQPPPARVTEPGAVRVTFVNHATLLVQMDGLNILTDPIYTQRAGPWDLLGPERARAPGIPWDDLPPIDVVLVSHNHYDHMDLPTLKRLAAPPHQPRIFAGLGSKAILDDADIPGGEDIDWWQSVALSDTVQLTSVPAQHWSRRGFRDAYNTLWTGYVLEGSGGPIFFAGDTAWGPHFEQVYECFGPMRLAMLPIGAYEPRWFMKSSHISPQEAADAAVVLRAETSVAMHFGTFKQLGDDGPTQGVETLRKYLTTMKDETRPNFWVLDFGEGRPLPSRLARDAEPRRNGDGSHAGQAGQARSICRPPA